MTCQKDNNKTPFSTVYRRRNRDRGGTRGRAGKVGLSNDKPLIICVSMKGRFYHEKNLFCSPRR